MIRIRWIDAMDLFGNGGYFDSECERYIVPKWFALLCNENDMGISDSEYENMETSDRYLRPPILSLMGCTFAAAQRIGISQTVLEDCGFSNPLYQRVFIRRLAGDNDKCPYGLSDTEHKAYKTLVEHIRINGLYWEYLKAEREIMMEAIKQWMLERGVEMKD